MQENLNMLHIPYILYILYCTYRILWHSHVFSDGSFSQKPCLNIRSVKVSSMVSVRYKVRVEMSEYGFENQTENCRLGCGCCVVYLLGKTLLVIVKYENPAWT
jgi:hypothetical protein